MTAEFITYYEVSNNEIWLRNFVKELCIVDDIKRPFKLFCDNKSVFQYSDKMRVR